MSLMSSSGSTPFMNMFIATLMMSRLPVRSPFPKSVPSTRSAPAMMPNSAAAVPVPRSLCGCREMMTLSRSLIVRQNHSMTSPYTFAV